MPESLGELVRKLLNGEIKPTMTLEEMEAWEAEANREIAEMREQRCTQYIDLKANRDKEWRCPTSL